ncbi:unnamed protein product [Porites lobata]|uniref:Helitron helicase-like domain-containing protein n=1 Tax=Porites lobata TaxID=104759 RepID=A0ABN8MRY3_9CNID|nr:unnamed protein product [Porites lobata]
MAFPTLFPDGKGDPTNPSLRRDIPLGERVKHLLKFGENKNDKWVYRFATHPRFGYWALNMIQRKRILQQTGMFLKQNPGEAHLTAEELRQMATSNNTSMFISKISRYLISNNSTDNKRQNVINNPHITDWFFTQRLESFIKYWLYNSLDAEWHWYRFEYQARGSIHCHGVAKLKNDPGLCKLSETALKGYLAEMSTNTAEQVNILELNQQIVDGKKASQVVCQYVDWLLSTYNPDPPDNGTWFPFEPCVNTKLEFEPIHTKDGSTQYKAKIITKRNDSRLNNHQRLQLQGWRANCDIQVIIDYHACVEYLAKYASKVIMKSLGQRDFSAQETMHHLMSLKLVSSSFNVVPISLNGSRESKL